MTKRWEGLKQGLPGPEAAPGKCLLHSSSAQGMPFVCVKPHGVREGRLLWGSSDQAPAQLALLVTAS